MTSLQRVCVFCASSPGSDPAITDATIALGTLLAERNIELIYGGGAVGLMGLIADTVMTNGGRVTGVIPAGLFPAEVGHRNLTTLEARQRTLRTPNNGATTITTFVPMRAFIHTEFGMNVKTVLGLAAMPVDTGGTKRSIIW